MINYPIKRKPYKPRGNISKSKTRSKYNNVISEFDNITFDSNKEKGVYILLNQLKQSNRIKSFTIQVEYELQEGYKNALGNKIRPIKYLADFKITDNNNEEYIIDVKGVLTEVFRIKKKLFEKKYDKILHVIKDEGMLIKLLKI
jgi:hypothetical protein